MRNRPIIRGGICVVTCAFLVACAGNGESRNLEKTYNSEIAQAIGCEPDEVAVCIEVNCELDEYKCSARENVREFFKAGEFRH